MPDRTTVMHSRWLSSTGLLLALGLFVAVNIVASATLTSMRLDLTENRLYTLSDGTRNILRGIAEPVTLRFYYSARAFADIPQLSNYGRRVRDMLEEYVAHADGKLKLKIVDPEPFSEAEDQAVAFGMRQVPIGEAGQVGYFGLFGTNTTDDEEVIDFFQPEREQSLEYDLTRLIYSLTSPKKRVVGIISSLPVFGEPGAAAPGTPEAGAWGVVTLIRDTFTTRMIDNQATAIDPDVDTLMIIHPKKLGDRTLYAIDQFVLHGGKAMVFVDPLSEEDPVQPDPASPLLMPERDSNLERLFNRWGVKLVEKKIVSDINAAIRVQYSGSRGPQEIEYAPWLHLTPEYLDQDDFITNQLSAINVGSAGTIEALPGARTTLTPLIFSGKHAMLYERDAILFQRDPARLLQLFSPDGRQHIIAARVRGMAETAFPEGRPKSEADKGADPDFIKAAKEPISVVVVADTDILADRFWVRFGNFLGQNMPQPFADNATFVINALDNLGGNDDLISLRSRARYARPFDRVEAIRKQAEATFRKRERELQEKLDGTEKKIAELQAARGDSAETLLTPEQKAEIDRFRSEQVRTRKELRAVQHDLQKDIERLGATLKFINIGLVPLLVVALALLLGLYRSARLVPR